MKKRMRFWITILSLATTTLLAGCASIGQAPLSTEEVVRARAQERIDFLHVRNFDKAYDYLAPSYRAINDVKAYRNRFGSGISWVDPKVTQVKCEENDRCIVSVELGVLVVARGFGGKPIPSHMSETWVKENGQWWFHQRE